MLKKEMVLFGSLRERTFIWFSTTIYSEDIKEGMRILENIIKTDIANYLQNKIHGDVLIGHCKEIYEQSLKFDKYNLTLELHMLLPFVHEFAYCKYTDRELREQVIFLERLLKGKEEYQYSSFLKLSSSNSLDKEMYDLYLNFEHTELRDIYYLFGEKIKNPKTFKDILYNCIYDIVSKVDATNIQESDFDCVNCHEDISWKMIKGKILDFLSYYLGIKPFYITVSVCQEGKIIYTIS